MRKRTLTTTDYIDDSALCSLTEYFPELWLSGNCRIKVLITDFASTHLHP
jgi:hypothetical protein